MYSRDFDVIIVGGGLAGISCAFELIAKKKKVLLLESRSVFGGRTSSWNADGMKVESGLHKFIGYYKYLPRLLDRAGLDINDVVKWEGEAQIRLPDHMTCLLGLSPLYKPISTIWGGLF